MRVALITETYPRNMGYLETGLPKHLAQLGAEVHVLATDLPPYHRWATADGQMPAFIRNQAMSAGSVESIDGYTVHILPTGWAIGSPFIRTVVKRLSQLRPDVIYVTASTGWLPLQAAAAKIVTGSSLFTGNHTGLTGFPAALRRVPLFSTERAKIFLMRWVPGRLVSLVTDKCYCVTADAVEVAWRFFGVQRHKAKLAYLGVDSKIFYPVHTADDEERRRTTRGKLGFDANDVVCIHTGKLTAAKNPLLLAEAIRRLSERGRRFRGLFVGDGAEKSALERAPGCVVLGFMPTAELGDFYRAADIAVWPATESISMLDAAACGVPLVVSNQIYQDHVTGNGYAYRQNDVESLMEVLIRLDDRPHRSALGNAGVHKMLDRFSWTGIAAQRLRDFQTASEHTSRHGPDGPV